MDPERERHSEALAADLISDPSERARQEARNGLRQFDEVIELIESSVRPERPFRLRPSMIMHLNRLALEGINPFAGTYRPGGVEIKGSKHTPPGAHLVAGLMEEMCDYVNDRWSNSSPIHLSAYVLWRMNWIHPFADGNGRTARASSYAVLCIRLGYRLPGTQTITEQISNDKPPYYKALEVADKHCQNGTTDVSEMEQLLEGCLATQLASVLKAARTQLAERQPEG